MENWYCNKNQCVLYVCFDCICKICSASLSPELIITNCWLKIKDNLSMNIKYLILQNLE